MASSIVSHVLHEELFLLIHGKVHIIHEGERREAARAARTPLPSNR